MLCMGVEEWWEGDKIVDLFVFHIYRRYLKLAILSPSYPIQLHVHSLFKIAAIFRTWSTGLSLNILNFGLYSVQALDRILV